MKMNAEARDLKIRRNIAINQRFEEMKRTGYTSKATLSILSEEFFLSIGTLRRIVYSIEVYNEIRKYGKNHI